MVGRIGWCPSSSARGRYQRGPVRLAHEGRGGVSRWSGVSAGVHRHRRGGEISADPSVSRTRAGAASRDGRAYRLVSIVIGVGARSARTRPSRARGPGRRLAMVGRTGWCPSSSARGAAGPRLAGARNRESRLHRPAMHRPDRVSPRAALALTGSSPRPCRRTTGRSRRRTGRVTGPYSTSSTSTAVRQPVAAPLPPAAIGSRGAAGGQRSSPAEYTSSVTGSIHSMGSGSPASFGNVTETCVSGSPGVAPCQWRTPRGR